MERLKIEDDLEAAVTKLGEGNSDAEYIAKRLSFRKPIALVELDTLGLRGKNISIFFSKECGGDLEEFIRRVGNDDVPIYYLSG